MSHPVFTVGSLYQMGVSIQDIEKKKMCRTYILKKFYAMSFGPFFFVVGISWFMSPLRIVGKKRYVEPIFKKFLCIEFWIYLFIYSIGIS